MHDLIGAHIDVNSGAWTETVIKSLRDSVWVQVHGDVFQDTGIGGGVDSFYEYLFKYWLLYDDSFAFEALAMFTKAYQSTERFMRHGFWYALKRFQQRIHSQNRHVDVNMFTGAVVSSVFTNLRMFWPGLQVLLGDIDTVSANFDCDL